MAEQFGGKQHLEAILDEVATQAKAEPAIKKVLPGWEPLEPVAAPASVRAKPKPKGRVMTREQAEAMAKNLEGYDGQIKAGRLTGG